MANEILLYLGSLLTVIWGVAHLFPTRSVVSGFGEITTDNRRIITMEWIVEGVALICTGVLVSAVTLIDSGSDVAIAVYITSSAMLIVLALVSLFTGYRVNFLPFKLCPFIFGASAVLILIGTFV
jgi:predicted RND superfamily exporter protein